MNSCIKTVLILSLSAQTFAVAQAQLVIPSNAQMHSPIYSSNMHRPIFSIDDKIANLKLFQSVLQAQLASINKMINGYQQFANAQKALGLNWVEVNAGQVPANALGVDIGNNKKDYVCSAKFQHGAHPGIVVTGGCEITYGGNSLIVPVYQILTGESKISWQADSEASTRLYLNDATQAYWNRSTIPVTGGFEHEFPLLICRANYNNVFYLGKMVGNNCNIAVGAKEIKVSGFQLMFATKKS